MWEVIQQFLGNNANLLLALIIVNAVLSAAGAACKVLAASSIGVAYPLIGKVGGWIGKIVDILSANLAHPPAPAPAPEKKV